MDLSKVKMVVTDMDGTLLNSNHEVSDRFFELYQKLKDKNILFIAASGRQRHSIEDKLAKIKEDIIVVAENGAFVTKQNKEILSTPLSTEVKNKTLEVLDTIENIHPILCTKNKAYLPKSSSELTNKLKEFYSSYDVVDNLKEYTGEVLKIAIYHSISSEKYIYPHVQHLEDQVKVKVSGENWVDISSANANKGYAIEKLQKLYNITPEETMAFGDYNNDLEMLQQAHFSFAMANAHPNVKAVANYETASNDDFGLEKVLESLLMEL